MLSESLQAEQNSMMFTIWRTTRYARNSRKIMVKIKPCVFAAEVLCQHSSSTPIGGEETYE